MKTYAALSIRLFVLASTAFVCAMPTTAKAKRAGERSAECRAAMAAEGQIRRTIDQLIEDGILLGPYQYEAIVKVSGEEKMIPEAAATKNASSAVKSKKPFKELAKFLAGTSQVDAPARRDFAEKVVSYIETHLLPIDTPKSPIERRAALQEITRKFYSEGALRPGVDKADKAWDAFQQVMKTPDGREILTVAIMNSNGAVARTIYKNQYSAGTIIKFSTIAFGIGPAAGWLFGMDTSHLLPLVGPAMGLTSASAMFAPISTARLALMRSAEGKRLKELLSQGKLEIKLGKTPDQATLEAAVAQAPPIDQATEPELEQVFNRELVKTEAQDLEKIQPTLGAGDFNAVSTFGVDLISRVDQAVDLIALMSKRMTLLENDVDVLSKSIAEGKLTVPLNNVIPIIERSFKTSSDVLQDGEQLEVYLSLLDKKISEHVTLGQDALDKSSLVSGNAKAEMEDVLEELRNAQLTIQPSTKILPMMNQVAQSQRSAIRDLRSSLRGQKLSHSEQIGKLVDAITKLKDARISEAPKPN
jgi:hypothetical protein